MKGQLGFTGAYLLLTLPSFITRKHTIFCIGPSFVAMCLFALVGSLVAIPQAAFWRYILTTSGLIFGLLIYDGLLWDRIGKQNEAMVIYTAPLGLWFIFTPISILLHAFVT